MRTMLVVVAVLCSTVAWGDIIRGRVTDQDTGEPLPEATVRFMRQLSENSYNVQTVPVDTSGYFTFFTDGRGSLDISVLGYYDKSRTVMALSDSRRDTMDIGNAGLKISPQLLKLVEVTARARRFTMRGDTIVFNPQAFKLSEGARLDELIRQLPGVEMDKDGKLSWNGKPIRLTMDGESLFGGDALVNQLPAEAVQSIKAYNKASELSEQTGRNDGTEDMVLDLSIKPGFLDRWYGDVKAGLQTKENYEGELVMNRLSKNDPVLVYADANNMEKTHRRYMNRSMSSWGNGFGNEQGASAGYQHNWNKMADKKNLRSYVSISGGLAHDDNWNTSGKQTDNYFPNTAASRISTETYHRKHGLSPTVNTNLRWNADSLNLFSLQANLSHNQLRSHSSQTSEQEMFDQVDTGIASPTLTQLTASRSQGHETKMAARGSWSHKIHDGNVVLNASINMSDHQTEQWTDRTITDYRAGDATTLLSQHSTDPSSSLATQASVTYKYWMNSKWLMNMAYKNTYDRQYKRRTFESDGFPDAANTYRDHYHGTGHALTLGSTLNLHAVSLVPQVVGRLAT
ncbi:MAG: carboxypeptidase regulatory-like domain-containing protein [Muribaculaceae bacterium]|nr:carboxypeptidase regulatory-like domain-containing protein [Muribaculaceae bacterium]